MIEIMTTDRNSKLDTDVARREILDPTGKI